MFNSKKTVKDVSRPLMGKSNGSNSTTITTTTGNGAPANQKKLDMAKMLASRINLQRNLGTQVMFL